MNRLIALSIAMDETFTLEERLESVLSAFILSTLIHLPIVLLIINLGILFLRFVTLYAILGALALGSWVAVWTWLYGVSVRKKTIASTIPIERVSCSRALAFFLIVFSISLFILNDTLIQFF
ncbi:MAG: hypothetical protein ACQEQA_04055 [Bacillota bacterium]